MHCHGCTVSWVYSERSVERTSIAGGGADVRVLVLREGVGGQVLQHLLQHWHEPRQLELLLILPCIPVLHPPRHPLGTMPIARA